LSPAITRHKSIHKGAKPKLKSKEWIQAKKERQRAQGRDVKHDSKYTGRKRGGASKHFKWKKKKNQSKL